MEKLMVNLLAQTMEKRKGQPMVKWTGVMKVALWGIMIEKTLV